MRGFLRPSLRPETTEAQKQFAGFSRSRRSKLAKAAQTSLLKADQWASGTAVGADVGQALERGIAGLKKK